MADRIRLLPEVVANQIAAGEVVNRPASVVKEMMENAIDAGARSVKVNYRDGGRELIQIVDDGCGMSPVDARMAFDRHATSKIRTVDDIYALHTFGFRGEALASIAAVAQVELRTRQSGDETGTVTEINGGRFVSQQPAMCPAGSQFFVRNLFYNLPARRKFLEKSTASASQIKSEFQRVALCNPQIAFELYANDAPVYSLGATTLAGRIVDVVGRHIKQNLLEVSADTSIASIEGYIGRPAAAKRRNAEQFLFVNGRYFKSAYLVSAVMKAYEKLIPEGSQPAFFLYLRIDPSRIDVNVHPQKTEVKFADEEAVWQIVNAAVRETLAKTGAVPQMDFDTTNLVEIPVLERGAVYREPKAMSNRDYNPFSETYIDPTASAPDVDFTGFDVPSYTGGQAVADSGVPGRGYAQRQPRSGRTAPGGLASAAGFEEFASGLDPAGASDSAATEWASAKNPASDTGYADESTLEFLPSAANAEQRQLEFSTDESFSDAIPFGGYVIARAGGRLVAVDVRRARERILYQECLGMLSRGAAISQQLLFPERLEFSTDEYALLEEHAVELAALGFDFDCAGDNTIEVKGTPADLPADSIDRLLYELLQVFATPQTLEEVRRERIAAVMASGGARNGRRIASREEAEALLAALAATDNRAYAPSGKPIMAEITADDLRAKTG